jgi:hypothetical protein
MSLSFQARQPDGIRERQTEDTDASSGVLRASKDLAQAFFSANVAHLKLSPLTLDALQTAQAAAELCDAAPGEPVLRAGKHQLGGALADDELQRAVGNDHDALYVVFGVGLGHTARALRAITAAPIVIFEPDPGVLRALLELGPSDLSDFDIVCTTHDLTQIWTTVFNGRRAAALVHTPGYVAAYPDQATDLREALAELVQRSRINDNTHRLRARDWVADVLQNVELLSEHPGFLALAGQYRGVPAFIVGAGPSLGKNGQHLLQAQKKGLVFAVNSSARALDRLGVEPQVLCCMESIDVSHLLRNVGFIDRVVRAFSLSAHPETLRTGQGPLLAIWEAVSQISHPLKQLTGYPGVPVSGSVSTQAFALAQRLGCSPIVFVGQDLAYTDGRAYAAGTAYEDSRVGVSEDGRTLEMAWCNTVKATHRLGGRTMHESEPLTETVAWGGQGKVLSGIGFSAVRAWLEAAAIILRREVPELRLVNATEGGAQITGFEEKTLAALLEDLPERSITAAQIAASAREVRALPTRTEIAEWSEHQADAVSAARYTARRIRRLATTTLAAIKQGRGNVSARLARLDAAEQDLSKRVAEAPLLDAWSWGDVDRVMAERSAPSNDAQKSAELSLAFEERFGSVIDRSARELETDLRQLSKRLRTTG